jgi:tRNA threonylcarbamoyladenosine biosynthesis protein TsaE
VRRWVTRSAEETGRAGEAFGAGLRPGDTVALIGTLGTGKTCFASGICRALGVAVQVTSPTFALVNEYPAPFGRVVHFDMYRIVRREELAELGFDEYFTPTTITLIEWGDEYLDLLPDRVVRVTFAHGEGPDERLIAADESPTA